MKSEKWWESAYTEDWALLHDIYAAEASFYGKRQLSDALEIAADIMRNGSTERARLQAAKVLTEMTVLLSKTFPLAHLKGIEASESDETDAAS